METISAISRLLVASLFYGTVLSGIALCLTWALRRRATPAAVAAIWTVVMLKFLIPVAPKIGLFTPMQPRSTAALLLADPAGIAATQSKTPLFASVTWQSVLLALWCAGSLFLAVRAIRRNLALHRELRNLPRASGQVLAFVEERAKLLGIKTPQVLIGASSPFVAGIFRPRLVLPDLNPGNTLEAMVLHELGHLKRHDHWMRSLQLVAAIIFFFWPPLRLALRRLEESREQACDALALERSTLPGRDYAQLLIDLHRRDLTAPHSALAMASRITQLEGRIDMIMESKARRGSLSISIFIGAFALLAVAAGARASLPDAPGNSYDSQAEELLKSGVEKAGNKDWPGSLADFNACVALPASDALMAQCWRNLGVVNVHARNLPAALTAFKAYLPYCNPDDCDKIKLLISKFEKQK